MALLAFCLFFVGCRSYANSTPREIFEGNNSANYERVFKEQMPECVDVLNSVVIGYAFRPGVVTTDDWEFEIIATYDWVLRSAKRFHLQINEDGFMQYEIQRRLESPIRKWYAVKALDEYELFRDLTSVGYVHMLVSKRKVRGSEHHIFISKH